MPSNKVALVTGASSGIGFELAKLFAKDSHDLVLVARDKKRLEKAGHALKSAYNVRCTTIVKDLSKQNAPKEIMNTLKKQNIRIHALVNNAGFGVYGKFHEMELQKQLDMIQTNITALTQLTGLILPEMIFRGEGRILNVASTAAFQPGPLMAVYYASKAYVLSFSEALSNELQGTGVTVTALCPGPTKTEFHARAHMEIERMGLSNAGFMSAARAAKEGYEALKKGKTFVIPGTRNRALAFLVRLTPRNTVTRIVRNIQEKNK